MQPYESIQALNFSTLKLVDTSPKLCKWRATKPRKDTAALAMGRAIHVAALEPDRWRRDFVVEPDFGPQQTKAGKPATNPKATEGYKLAFDAWASGLAAGVSVLDAQEYEIVERCADALHSHRLAGPLLKGGRAEHVVQWTDRDTGVLCKARLDYVPQCIVDIKSTRRETVRDFLSDSARLLYHVQSSWYDWGGRESGTIAGDAELPYVISVQTCEPYDVCCFKVPTETMDAGRAKMRELLTRYTQCQAADYWPGLGADLLYLDLPRWADGIDGDAW